MCLKELLRLINDYKAEEAEETQVIQPESLKDFETYAELVSWFDLHKELRMEPPNLCDDYSRESRALAELDGYYLSCCLVHRGMVYGIPVFTTPEGLPDESVFHIANLAIVNYGGSGNQECWYVDLAWSKLIKLCEFFSGGKW